MARNGNITSPLHSNLSQLTKRPEYNHCSPATIDPVVPINDANRTTPNTSQEKQEEGEDFGELFRSSMGLAYGVIDYDDNYDYMDAHPEEPPPPAMTSTTECTNCEMLKKEIESLKENQMPRTIFPTVATYH